MTNSSTRKSENKGVGIRIRGIVQGVGFRPFIYNLATQLHISGTVSNTAAGVFIQALADCGTLQEFIARIRSEAPPLSQIVDLEVVDVDVAPSAFSGFHILASEEGQTAATAIPPDIALCHECLGELLDPEDRRYGYPFINCTNCGPRFTIVETIPYDRPKTSMRIFPMCSECRREYDDPTNRRFHAQPNACRECGPQISWHDAAGTLLDCADPIREAVSALRRGRIVALRGLGGFHLVADGCNEDAIALLRRRKNRPTKPLAIMVRDIAAAERFCHVDAEERAMLDSPQHPIVLLRKYDDCGLPDNLGPGVQDLGVMLPYTPLHHLLFAQRECPAALVMTSGNRSGCPICISNASALSQLAGLADHFLLHNREILTRVDDSVIKKLSGRLRLLRRARGYTPRPLLLDHALPRVMGCGAGLKSTFCLARDRMAFLSQHIGDLSNLPTYDFFVESVNHHKKVFEIEPQLIVHDLHPDYMSTRFAEHQGLPAYAAQHHHAHAVAVMAEHHLRGPVLAVVLDGTGFGGDGTIWGGEILLSSLTEYTRLGHLQYVPLPGGDRAAEEPWRMALALLQLAYGLDFVRVEKNLPALLRTLDSSRRRIVCDMIEQGFNAPPTSSCGRLFDAVAALLDLRLFSDYEGHAAMELEALAMTARQQDWRRQLDEKTESLPSSFLSCQGGKWEIISSEFVKVLLDKRKRGHGTAQAALDFHFELIATLSQLVIKLSRQHNTEQVVLSGGCLQNRLLMEGLFHILERTGLQVFSGEKVPVNDGGISFGQIIIGGLQHVSRNSHAGDPGQRRPR